MTPVMLTILAALAGVIYVEAALLRVWGVN
jgi:hypothetical protein